MILKEQLENHFAQFKNHGFTNVKELWTALKKKDLFNELASMEGLSVDYLKILSRELNSMLPKPNKIKDFPGIEKKTVETLEKAGITNTLQLFDKVGCPGSRKELAQSTGIPLPVITELTSLADLSRIKWVGAKFARMLYDLGIDSVEKASKADPEKLHARLNQLNQEKLYYRGQIGLNDVKILVQAAHDVPLVIEYPGS
jgi:hypothetical protein